MNERMSSGGDRQQGLPVVIVSCPENLKTRKTVRFRLIAPAGDNPLHPICRTINMVLHFFSEKAVISCPAKAMYRSCKKGQGHDALVGELGYAPPNRRGGCPKGKVCDAKPA